MLLPESIPKTQHAIYTREDVKQNPRPCLGGDLGDLTLWLRLHSAHGMFRMRAPLSPQYVPGLFSIMEMEATVTATDGVEGNVCSNHPIPRCVGGSSPRQANGTTRMTACVGMELNKMSVHEANALPP